MGAPYVETLRGNRALAGALAAITAAVVGVIASLAVWFMTHALFAEISASGLPDVTSWRVVPAVLTGIALVMSFALRRGLGATLLVCMALGAAARLASL